MPTPPKSTAELVDLLRKSGAANPEKIAGLSEQSLPADPNQAAAELVARGLVTRFQAQQLLAGRHRGFRIGAYTILDLLGRGGMGAVYLGEHRDLQRKVAIKVLVPGRDEDQKLALERFQREARSAAALDHPNIVRLFDVSRHGDTPYLVMEYVEGETLQQVLDRGGPIPYPVATDYIAQAAAGLQHAHEKGFVHRDIKPGNLMREKSGVVKILDMGLARSNSSSDRLTEQLDQGAVVGTADFIAPEQGLNLPVDIRADVYALGATFFALLVGKPPFHGNTTQKLLQHQLKSPPPLVSLDPNLPKGLSEVTAKMLAKKPGDRFQTPGEVIAALTPWMANSSLVIAGLSRTNLSQSVELQAALAGISAGGSSQRLSSPGSVSVADSTEVDTSRAAQETGAVAGAVTTRETARPVPAAEKTRPGRRKLLLYGGIAAAVLVAGGLSGWLAFGGHGKPPAAAAGDRPAPEPAKSGADTPKPAPPLPKLPQHPNPVPSKKDAVVAGGATLRLDLAGQKPFVVRSGLSNDPVDSTKRDYRLVSQSGPGEPPAGWSARAWNAATEMEFFAEEGDRPALGLRNAIGPGSAMLFTPRFECPAGACRLRFEYSAAVHEGRFLVRFKPSDNRGAWDVVKPPVTGPSWRAEELEVDLRGATGGYFEFHNSDERPGAPVRLRSLAVAEAKGVARAETVLFALDAADLPAFRNTKTGRKKTDGDDDPRVKGVYFGGWKPETQSTWECGPAGGAKALGYTNLGDVISAQIGIELESAAGIGLKLEAGEVVRARVAYRTTGRGRGSVYFQNADDHKVPARVTLPNSNDGWATVDLVHTRRESPLRLLVDTNESGAGNTLFVRSVTVTQVAPVAASVGETPAAQPDASKWAEGASVFKFDASGVPTFRVQKEKGERIGGDGERLPAGVGCHCWKDGGVGDFRCDKLDGVPALGSTNLNDVKTGQFFFSLEGGMKVSLQPGKAYRVKVGYMTHNDATGHATVQVAPGYQGLGTAKLSNTGGAWKTALVSFVRPPAEDRVEVRFTVDNDAVGEGNTLWVRSLEIVELVAPGKK
jgi:serine/threonine protein kinase